MNMPKCKGTIGEQREGVSALNFGTTVQLIGTTDILTGNLSQRNWQAAFLTDGRDFENKVITLDIRPDTGEVAPALTTTRPPQVMAWLEYGTGNALQDVFIDVGRGLQISVPSKRLSVKLAWFGLRAVPQNPRNVAISWGFGTRPSDYKPALYQYAEIAAGGLSDLDIPPKTHEVEVIQSAQQNIAGSTTLEFIQSGGGGAVTYGLYSNPGGGFRFGPYRVPNACNVARITNNSPVTLDVTVANYLVILCLLSNPSRKKRRRN